MGPKTIVPNHLEAGCTMIRIEALVKYFHRGGINEVPAIEGVDLSVAKGDFITVIGSNGAGKSTLLNCLAGTVSIDEGRLWIDDTDVTKWPEHRRAALMGRVFQDPLSGTCATLSVEQNMALSKKRGAVRGLGLGVKRADRDYFKERLKILDLGLENRLNTKVGLLSGGQRQALTMLMAMMVRPKLLLLDEHTAALDPKTAQQILDLTQKIIAQQNITTIMVTHNMRQALAMGNRLIMLHQGRIIMDIDGKEKKALTVQDLLDRFYSLKGGAFAPDRALLV